MDDEVIWESGASRAKSVTRRIRGYKAAGFLAPIGLATLWSWLFVTEPTSGVLWGTPVPVILVIVTLLPILLAVVNVKALADETYPRILSRGLEIVETRPLIPTLYRLISWDEIRKLEFLGKVAPFTSRLVKITKTDSRVIPVRYPSEATATAVSMADFEGTLRAEWRRRSPQSSEADDK